MAEEVDELLTRVARLEALFGVLLMFEAGDVEAFDAYRRLVLRRAPFAAGPRLDELLDAFRRTGLPSRYRELQERLNALESRIQGTEARFEDVRASGLRVAPYEDSLGRVQNLIDHEMPGLRRSIAEVSDKQTATQRELHAYLAVAALGLDPRKVPLQRFLPVRIYLSVDDRRAVALISQALTAFAQSIDLEIADEFPEETGSWFKRLFTRTKDAVTQPEVTKRLRKAERALELAALQKAQADIDLKQAEAASHLIRSLENTPNGVCHVGSIFVVKVTDETNGPRIVTRSLTQAEMIELEQHTELIKRPQEMLRLLERGSARPIVGRRVSRRKSRKAANKGRRLAGDAAPVDGATQRGPTVDEEADHLTVRRPRR